MSGTSTSVSVASGGGEGIFRPPFTAAQWQELEHQALIYKYLVAGLPVPPDLVLPIRRSLEALSARFFHHPSSGYCSYYGKKFDPEPGRCRRTDGKKWRCSKDAYPDSKYCERHMHRGRNRSRKPVESQPTSQSLSTTTTGSSGSYGNLPLYSIVNSEEICFGSNVPKMHMEPVPYGTNAKEDRYLQGLTPEAESRGNVGSVMASQVLPHQSPYFRPVNKDSHLLGIHVPQGFEPIVDPVTLKRQQHCFFGGGDGSVKDGQQSMRPFFDEWPKNRESWLGFDEERSKNMGCSTTHLSMSAARSPDGVDE